MAHSPASRSAPARIGTLLVIFSMLAGLAAAPPPVAAEPHSAEPIASGFLIFKHPLPAPACTGIALNVSNAPYFGDGDCGFAVFNLSDVEPTTAVRVDFAGPDGATFASDDAIYDEVDAEWQFSIQPSSEWPAGTITAVVTVADAAAGSTSFGNHLLGATLEVDQATAPFAPGDDLAVSGNIAELDSATDLGPVLRTGVPATFSLVVATPAGDLLPVPGGAITAEADGDFSATVPGSLTADLAPVGDDVELTVAVAAVNASYDDPSTGPWAAADAGRTPVTLLVSPSRLGLRASFVSSTGWVKPGDTFPFRVFVTNATTSDASGVSVAVSAPPSVTFVDATPLNAAETATVSPGSITWEVGTLPAANAAGPMSRTLVVTARAATLVDDPEVVWKDLSTTATLTYDQASGPAITSATHGPKVIPAAAEFETARYGDKPFPIVPVEYVDLERQDNATFDNDAEKLDTVVNDPGFVGSTFNLYQEMSYGQLFPDGTVPSAGIAAASFSDYGPGFAFTTPDRTDPTIAACRGATAQEVPDVIGSPAFDTRIEDGWYQLPGTTEYYGGDFPVFTATTLSIDSACGPLGKAVFDAAQISDPEIDYNQYDSDKDGVVDFFMLVFVGCGGNGPSQLQANCQYFGSTPPYDNIWPHSSSLEAQFTDPETGLRGYTSDDALRSLEEVPQCWTSASRLQYDGCAANGGTGDDALPVFVRVGPYNVNPETVFQSASVISHEYGHHLGLPDFYDPNAEAYGDLNLMAADYSQHMTIFSKQELGWVVPTYLQPGDTETVSGWNEIKADTGTISWQRPDGTPYTLSSGNGDQNIHNGQAYGLKLSGRQLIDPAIVPSGTHLWWSDRGNDFGCSPTGGHNLDLALPELATVAAGTPVTLEFKSSWDIEWDWDYGFVLTSTDGQTFTSQPSEAGYTTANDFNPNNIACQDELDNGITGTSGAYQQGEPVVTVARAPNLNDYSHGAPFLDDSYDITELAGQANAQVRFSYNTDGAFVRPGWFIDDIVVRAGDTVIYSSEFEDGPEADRLGADGWRYVQSDAANEADHAYYLELRDQSGFDFDGHDQSERGDTSWQPGVFIEYTDEAHGYGNTGGVDPPSQHYLDSQPIPGSDCVSEQNGNCADVSFTAASGDSHFDDTVDADQPGGNVNSFSDANSSYGDGLWHFDYGCLSLDVTAMSGEGVGPQDPVIGDLSADATIAAGEGCATFGYGASANQAPIAAAQARPTEALVGEPITFDGSGSTDDRQAPSALEYAWDFGDGETGDGQSLQHAYAEAGTYTATLTVTDADGLTDTATVDVSITAAPDLQVTDLTVVSTGGGNGKPKAGERVTIEATVANAGSAEAGAMETAFTLDGEPLTGSPVATGAIAAGDSAIVTLVWDTRGLNGEHVIGATADSGEAVVESDDANNAATLDVTVRGNRVTNGDFEQSNAEGTAPEAWTGSSTGAGTTTYGDDGADGSRAAGVEGSGGNAALAGSPSWTSDAIEVMPGELLTLELSVTSTGATSAASAGLAYLGPAGELLDTVRLISVPLTTDGFQVLTKSVTLPPGVTSVRVVLTGFAPTDLRTAGTVVFDDVGLFGE